MTIHSKAYIFRQQQLLVDHDFQLPLVEKIHDDLNLSENGEVIARDLQEDELVPEGYQLVPIASWSRFGVDHNLKKLPVLCSCWDGDVITAIAVIAVIQLSSMRLNIPWSAHPVVIASILVSILV